MHNVGETVTGTCVTMGTSYTGRVAEVQRVRDLFGRLHEHCEVLYRITDTGAFYAGGRPIEPLVRA